MRAEPLQVLALRRVPGVVPVADVDEVDGVGGQTASPVDQLRHRSSRRLGPEQAGRFGVADVQQVGQGIVWADGVNEIALETLGDKDRGHLRCGQKSQQTA
jgi:hypothetical protein